MRNAHQADHVLRAFRYQLLQSIVAWLDLHDDEVLWIEVAEDYSVESQAGSHSVQVKHSDATDGPRPISLRTKEVRDTLLRFWDEASLPSAPPHRLTFLARSGAARERNSPLSAGTTGIECWSKVAMGEDVANSASLRSLLTDIFRDTSLGAWLTTKPSEDEFRQRLLARVQFSLNSKDDAALEAILLDRLGALYLSKRHYASAADTGLALLLSHVFRTGSLPHPEARRLTRVDLHSKLEEAIPRQGAYDQLFNLGGQVEHPGAHEISVGEVRVRSDLIDRHQLVSQIGLDTKNTPIVWLTGSNGVGKSTLASLLSRSRGGRWLHCDIRPFVKDGRDQAVRVVWRELMSVLNRSGTVAGVILDDLPAVAADLLKVRIAGLASMLRQQDAGQLIITSNHKPSGGLRSSLGLAPGAVIEAPYFTIEETMALVGQDQPPEARWIEPWARLIHATTNGGHPLLAISKISNLRQRGWPVAALREDIGGNPGAGIVEARAEARARLLAELTTPSQRELLARVSVVFNMFDEALARRLAHEPQAIDKPGDALVALRGSWIEVLAEGYLRLSPLISDLQGDVPAESARRWRQLAAEHWMMSGVLNEQTIPLVFWNAFLGQHAWVLFKVCQATLPLSPELLRAVGGVLAPLVIMRTDAPLWEQPELGSMLRLIQIRAADAVEDERAATEAARAWLREIETVEHATLRRLMILTSPPHFFQLGSVRLPAIEQLQVIDRVRVAIDEGAADSQEVRDAVARMAQVLPKHSSIDSFFFSQGLMSVRSSKEFEEMVVALDGYSADVRNRWLDGATAVLEGAGVWIHNAWSSEQLGHKDLRPALDCYSRMTRIVATWRRPDLEAEFVFAQSILLNEGLGESDRACAIIREGMDRLGRRVVLLRQLSKLLASSGDWEGAAQIFRESEPALASLYSFEQVLALRDGGVVYAEAGLFSDASRTFVQARNLLESSGRNESLQAALLIEEGIVEAKQGRKRDALALVARSLEILGRGDPSATRQGQRALIAARDLATALGTGMRILINAKAGEIAHGSPSQSELSDPPTFVSNLSVSTVWQLLEIAEVESGEDIGITKQVARHLKPDAVKPELRLQLLRARFSAAIKSGDVERTIAASIPLIDLALTVVGGEDRRDELRQAALVDVILFHALQHTWTVEVAQRLISAVPPSWCAQETVRELIASTYANAIDRHAPWPQICCSLVSALLWNADLLPLDRFVGDLFLMRAVLLSNARNVLEPLVLAWLITGWRRVLETQRFHLRNPRNDVPSIEDALNAVEQGGLRLAGSLFLVLAEAVDATIPPDMRKLFDLVAGK
ncbi:MAG: hypothetical protein SXG53_14860 [Pseudomonadota bacterium]|nr:hypothetical protein [Pseudomonadota bacterium]